MQLKTEKTLWSVEKLVPTIKSFPEKNLNEFELLIHLL